MHAPTAIARPSDVRWEGTVSRFQTGRHIVERDDEEARPRRRSGRSHAGARRRGHRQERAASARGTRAVSSRSAHRKQHAQKIAPRARQAIPPLANAGPSTEIVPLAQRSIVATHPLALDPVPTPAESEFADAPAPGAIAAAPRCKTVHLSTFALAVASLEGDFQVSEPAMVEGAWPHCRGARNPQSNWRLASLGPTLPARNPSASPSLSGGSIRWVASADCLASPLRAILAQVTANFGPLTVNSTCRSPGHNSRVGGAPRSYHLSGNAVDFRVRSNFSGVLAFLTSLRSVGGLTHYGSGVFHIDTGPRRTWGARRARLAYRR